MERSYRYVVRPYRTARLTLIGCGGTGSFVAGSLARLAHVLKENRLRMSGWFIDPDRVTQLNIGRQNFCAADTGKPKAQVLAERYGPAYGWPVDWTCATFREARLGNTDPRSELDIIIGAVDSRSARADIASTFGGYFHSASPRIWIDCGNDRSSGQVLVGMRGSYGQAATPLLEPTGLCCRLPLPSEQHPELVEGKAGKTRAISCAEYVGAGEQDLFVNQMVAAIAAAYLDDLLLRRELTTFATYFDLETRGMRSLKINRKNLADWLPQEEEPAKAA